MAQETPNIDSLFDYFYLDTDRLSHWLAQLDDGGVLSSFRHSKSFYDGLRNELGINAGLKGGQSSSESHQENQERVYDSEWTRPLLLLDLLSQAEMIQRDINKAPIGSLVLVSGPIQIFDISLLQNAWDSIGGLIFADKVPKKAKSSMTRSQRQTVEFYNTMGGLLKAMPNSPQIYLKDASDEVVWASLEPDFIVGNPATLALSNGPFLSGTWNAVGILDGHRDDSSVEQPEAFAKTEMSEGICQMLTAVKDAVGRGHDTFSMTPLMIFRAVTKRS